MSKQVLRDRCFHAVAWGLMPIVLLAPGGTVTVTCGQCEGGLLDAPDGATGDLFGASVVISLDGGTALVGAPWHDNAGMNSGAAYVFVLNGPLWHYQAELVALDGGLKDVFGWTVAVSESGDIAIVGAFLDDDAGKQSGSAYVFRRKGATWTEEVKLVASDAVPIQEFGSAVAISADGLTALVGARYDNDACPGDPDCQSGSAYVYTWDGSAWVEEHKLTALDAAPGDHLGGAVALSIHGDVAIVGANEAGSGPGSAYVFVREGKTWSQEAKLTASDGVLGNGFGGTVGLSGDGSTALVGATGASPTPGRRTSSSGTAARGASRRSWRPGTGSRTTDSGPRSPSGPTATSPWSGPFGTTRAGFPARTPEPRTPSLATGRCGRRSPSSCPRPSPPSTAPAPP